jgi:hypothetical protein
MMDVNLMIMERLSLSCGTCAENGKTEIEKGD